VEKELAGWIMMRKMYSVVYIPLPVSWFSEETLLLSFNWLY